MSIHRRAILPVIIVAALALLGPAAAGANSLLSGYGGPGQGSQAILGSGLINGGGGGGSGGGSSGVSSASAAPSAPVPTRSTVPSGSATRSSRHGRRAAAKPARSPVGRIPATSAEGAYPASANDGSQTVSGASDPLGVSGVDLLYILIAAGALVLTGLVTRQLTQTAQKPSNAQARFDRTARH